eukprot:g73998.t1
MTDTAKSKDVPIHTRKSQRKSDHRAWFKFFALLALAAVMGFTLALFVSLPEPRPSYNLFRRLLKAEQPFRLGIPTQDNGECAVSFSQQCTEVGEEVGASLATEGGDDRPAGAPLAPPPSPILPAGTRVVLINLKRRPERLKDMQAVAQQLHLLDQLYVQEAVDGTNMGEDGLRRYAVEKLGITAELSFEDAGWGNPYSVFGTLLSHATVLADFLESKDNFALVLEDDIHLAKGLDDALRALAMLTELDPHSFDMIYLESLMVRDFDLVGSGRFMSLHPKASPDSPAKLIPEVLGMGAILYSRKAAATFIEHVRRAPNRPCDLIWSLILQDPHRQVRALVADPPVFRQYLFKYTSDNRKTVQQVRFLLYRSEHGEMKDEEQVYLEWSKAAEFCQEVVDASEDLEEMVELDRLLDRILWLTKSRLNGTIMARVVKRLQMEDLLRALRIKLSRYNMCWEAMELNQTSGLPCFLHSATDGFVPQELPAQTSARQCQNLTQKVGASLATEAGLPAGTRVVLINLKRRPERLKDMQAVAQQLHLLDRLYVQEAVDGTNVGEDGLRRYAVEKLGITAELSFEDAGWGNPYSVFGTLLSHATVLADFLERKDNFALVLEDDIHLAKGLDDALRALAMLTELDPHSFDMIYLESLMVRDFDLVGSGRFMSLHPKASPDSPAKLIPEVLGMGAILYSRKAAATFIEHVRRAPNRPCDLIWSLILQDPHRQVRALVADPPVFRQYLFKYTSDNRKTVQQVRFLLYRSEHGEMKDEEHVFLEWSQAAGYCQEVLATSKDREDTGECIRVLRQTLNWATQSASDGTILSRVVKRLQIDDLLSALQTKLDQSLDKNKLAHQAFALTTPILTAGKNNCASCVHEDAQKALQLYLNRTWTYLAEKFLSFPSLGCEPDLAQLASREESQDLQSKKSFCEPVADAVFIISPRDALEPMWTPLMSLVAPHLEVIEAFPADKLNPHYHSAEYRMPRAGTFQGDSAAIRARVKSHRRALQRFLSTQYKTSLVLEQEVELASTLYYLRSHRHTLPSTWEWSGLASSPQFAGEAVQIHSSVWKSSRIQSAYAYLITRSGAVKVLSYSLPMFGSLDAMFSQFSLAGKMDCYFANPPSFSDNQSTDLKEAPIPEGFSLERASISRALAAESELPLSLAESEAWRIQQLSSLCGQQAQLPLCASASDADVQRLEQNHCRVVVGEGPSSHHADTAEQEFMTKFPQQLSQLGLERLVVWGLRDKFHTHMFLHASFLRAFIHMLGISPQTVSVCHLDESDGPAATALLTRALVVASPQHMLFGHDPALLLLPASASNMYIMHGDVPFHLKPLQLSGRLVRWLVWGPAGSTPVVESKDFVLPSMPWQSNPDECWRPVRTAPTPQHKFFSFCSREMIMAMPWATHLLPSEIRQRKVELERMPENLHEDAKSKEPVVFIGSIWTANADKFLELLQGCAQEQQNVIRYGRFKAVHPDQLKGLEPFMQNGSLVDMGALDSEHPVHVHNVLSKSRFGLSLQGEVHLGSGGLDCYIADRVLNVIGSGLHVVSNNPCAKELLNYSNAVHVANTSDLCRAGARAAASQREPNGRVSLMELMEQVARHHTYMSRFTMLLEAMLEIQAET